MKPARNAVQSSSGPTPRISSSPVPTSARPPRDEPAHAVAVGELARERRDEERQQRDGQEAQAGLQGRVAERVLDVERQVEEHREHRRRQHERRDATRRRTSGCRNSDRSSIGCATRRSATTNATSSSTAATSSPTISPELQPSALPRISAKIRHTRPPENVDQPRPVDAALRRAARLVDLGERHRDRADADRDVDEEDELPAQPLGERARRRAARRPRPRRWSRPTGRTRSPGRDPGTRSRAARAPSRTSARAPLPWIARATLSSSGVPASPHSSEATVKIASPITNTSRRPNRSASDPPVSSSAASVSA